MGKTVFISALILLISPNLIAETLEERVRKLENKVIQLEERVQKLENIKNKQAVKDKKNPVYLEVVSKRFKPLNIKERLWEKGDKILLYVRFKNITGKSVKNIKGIIQINSISGKKLMETEVNINKAFNFITGMDIKPEEIVEMKVSFLFDKKNPDHIYVKEKSIRDLKILFLPLEVQLSNGTVIKY